MYIFEKVTHSFPLKVIFKLAGTRIIRTSRPKNEVEFEINLKQLACFSIFL
jgi:hypothetical protein